MNKLQSYTKVSLAAIGIFFTVRTITQMMSVILLYWMQPSLKSIVATIIWIPVFILALALILYVFLYKGKELARLIAGTSEPSEQTEPVDWLPAAFRLVCIGVGLYIIFVTLYNVIFSLSINLARPFGGYSSSRFPADRIISHLLSFAMGIYLVCGAPHFERWHIRKAKKMDKQLREDDLSIGQANAE